jgi:hypothetical protein
MKRVRAQHVKRATRGVTFDTGMLVALERRKSGALALLKACMLSHARIVIPAGVVAEWWRGTHRALLDCGAIEPLSPQLGLRAGELLALTGGSNAIDAAVVASAAQRGDWIATGDVTDLAELAVHAPGVDIERA